ncbi:hypothetical protein G9C85_10405 [Halorubellus sp. JP-L1]|uniref:DUF7331 family protein n=1 Tax=Halorubellus sp. JP-L1 TaxID=2715753 RepID=UPI001407C377|nr:hypothetical protein [Halorubellus sp. JP-L1]NHN42037.1 hypothetical protein [Halorubellus sp. JP-L1]
MEANAQDDADDRGESPVPNRYAAIETGEGDVVVFDAEADDAWIQTSRSIALSNLR